MSRSKSPEYRLADFTTDRRVLLLTAMAALIGILSALVAYVLVWLIGVITNLCYYHRMSSSFVSPAGNQLGGWAVIIPVLGGLAIGFIARFGSEKIRGHGIPEALEAILIGRSRMEPKVAVLKPLSSALSIGTGGPFGAEGPIIMTGGALGSLFAQMFHLTASERKTLLTAGAAGGMAAIFAAPVASVLLAVELLLFEWKPRSLIPVAIASAVSGGMRVLFLGNGPVFPVPAHAALGGPLLVACFAVGIISGVGSGLLTTLVYAFEDLFHRLPFHWMWWPAIGGLAVGIGGLIDPRVLGVGYDTIHLLLQGKVVLLALISLLFLKALVWAIALGSGTSGGVLAPLLILGGALGALLGHWIPIGDISLWAMMGMAGMMGGTMRSPFTAIVFTLELTHDLNVLPGLLLATIAAEAVTVLLLPRSILTEKVARRGYHITREYSIDPTSILRVSEIMNTSPPTVPGSLLIAELSQRMMQGDLRAVARHGAVVVDEDGRIAGIITHGDILRAIEGSPNGAGTVLDASSDDVVVAYPDELVHDAILKMLRYDVGRLPVVSREEPEKMVGFVRRADLMKARIRRLEEEDLRESGFSHRAE